MKVREVMRKMNAKKAIRPRNMNASVDFNTLMMQSKSITDQQRNPNAAMRRSYGGHETKPVPTLMVRNSIDLQGHLNKLR